LRSTPRAVPSEIAALYKVSRPETLIFIDVDNVFARVDQFDRIAAVVGRELA
jgi:hypothetical protein